MWFCKLYIYIQHLDAIECILDALWRRLVFFSFFDDVNVIEETEKDKRIEISLPENNLLKENNSGGEWAYQTGSFSSVRGHWIGNL